MRRSSQYGPRSHIISVFLVSFWMCVCGAEGKDVPPRKPNEEAKWLGINLIFLTICLLNN